MPQSESQSVGKRRPLRLLLAGLLGVGVFACLVGALAWYLAEQAAAKALDALIASEEAHGRVWSCPERRISGFPLALELSCLKPSFSGLISGKPMVARMQALHARVHLLRPHEVTAQIEAPLALRSEDGRTDLSFTWSSMQFVGGGVPEDIAQVAFRGEGLATQGLAEGFGALVVQAGRFDGMIGKSARGQDRAYDFRFAAQDVASPWLVMVLGSQQPAEIKTEGTVTEVSFDLSARPAESLEHWRAKDGRIDFGNLGFSQGEMQVSARGTLKLDAAHRLQGRLDTGSLGIEPILRRHGINPSLATAGLLLSSLFGGKAQAAAPPSAPAVLHVPLRLEGGAVIVGPVQTSIRLPALY
ncbi:MAG: DUF2125 domain-containing protein [Beijerinckiaceae bacterium]